MVVAEVLVRGSLFTAVELARDAAFAPTSKGSRGSLLGFMVLHSTFQVDFLALVWRALQTEVSSRIHKS